MLKKLNVYLVFAVFSIVFSPCLLSEENLTANSLAEFVKLSSHRDVQISPDGKHLSLVYQKDGYDMLVVIDKSTNSILNAFKPRGNSRGVYRVAWVNNSRLVYSVTQNFVFDKQPISTGELTGVDIDGGRHEIIFGFSAGESTINTRVRKKEAAYGSHRIIDLLEDDERNILITFYPWTQGGSDAPNPTVYKLDVYTGKRKKIDTLPSLDARAIVDSEGNVRFAVGTNKLNEQLLWYKETKDDQWKEFSLAGQKLSFVEPKSFTDGNQGVYFSANIDGGTEGLFLFNFKNNEITKLFHDERLDISEYVKDFDQRRIVAVGVELGAVEYHYLDKDDRKAKLHSALVKSFVGYNIIITSETDDASEVIVYAYSDTNPGDYYLFNTKEMRADFIVSNRGWIDIDKTKPMEPIQFKTRDGVTLNGYLTLPKKGDSKLPLVVLPHGGPHGARDYWGYEWEVQLLASRGYAVLQVNFRGSAGFGKAFEVAGYHKWGTLMQDDITDATKAMIEKGIVDPKRICIYGASFGGYSALMGAIREPDLYQCAIGSVGVYDLPMLYDEGDVSRRDRGVSYLKTVIGDDEKQLKSQSPIYNTEKIKANILLVHGSKDYRAPIEHAESLKDALDKNGKKYEWLEMSNEGHGYYDEENRLAVYSKIIAFLDKNIGDNSKRK